jgi:hypothetical protein
VESARPRRRVQSETMERRAQWLVVGERMRLEGREATHPLRYRLGHFLTVAVTKDFAASGLVGNPRDERLAVLRDRVDRG